MSPYNKAIKEDMFTLGWFYVATQAAPGSWLSWACVTLGALSLVTAFGARPNHKP